MGVKNGARDIVQIVKFGLFKKRNVSRFNINIDGEFMRYKGMIESNLTKHNAEEAIAFTSFEYMDNLTKKIESFLGVMSDKKLVYMDGSRVINKESIRPEFQFDSRLIRTNFKLACSQFGYDTIDLTEGESELQMYLKRDKTVCLNVFVTADSDMISICYGHKPSLSVSWDEIATNLIPPSFTSNNDFIVDTNWNYPDNIDVKDSCLWIQCCKGSDIAVGFDWVEKRCHFNVNTFRTFISLCGTDFTNSLLTESMITGTLLSDLEHINFINNLTNYLEITAMLLFLGVKSGGTIKRYENKMQQQQFNLDDIKLAISMYIDYIATGQMKNVSIPRPCMGLVCRHFLYALKGQDSDFVKKTLHYWANSISMEEALDNFRKFIGTFDPTQINTLSKKTRLQREDSEIEKIIKKRQKTSSELNDTYVCLNNKSNNVLDVV